MPRIPNISEVDPRRIAGERPVTPWSPSGDGLGHTLTALVGSFMVLAFVTPAERNYGLIGLVFVALLLGLMIARSTFQAAEHLPFVGGVAFVVGPGLGITLVMLVASATHQLPGLAAWELLVTGVLMGALLHVRGAARSKRGRRPVRIALLGSSEAASKLTRELRVTGLSRYTLAGTLRPDPRLDHAETRPGNTWPEGGESGTEPSSIRCLGSVAALPDIVAGYRLDLLLIAHDHLRPDELQGIAELCTRAPLRVASLSEFCENVFGHVPISEIDGSWFRYLMHPDFRMAEPPLKRALDLVVGVAIGLAVLPVLGLLALLVRRDGGPALFRQMRIGEGGRQFTLYKLRSMRVGAENAWTSSDDDRVTRLGRFLRRTHLDELPQVINVIRGEMSLVGPRPEQPSFVARLEQLIPFYSPRHSIKPGLTGWAQVRGGYAGSGFGSAQKLCYDLYYLKHRSVALDLVILAETLRMTVLHHQYPEEATSPSLLLDSRFRELQLEAELPRYPTPEAEPSHAEELEPAAAERERVSVLS